MTAAIVEDDAVFLAAFEAGVRPGGAFRHADHVRLAWLYLRRDGAAQGEDNIAAGIRRFAAAQGGAGFYHETLTRAWVRLVAAALAKTPQLESFTLFFDAHPELADKAFLFHFYSAEALSLPAARDGWIEPDRALLP